MAGLMTLLTKWRQLTQQEGEAIRSSDWKSVAEAQDQKAELKQQMIGLLATDNSAASSSRLRPVAPEPELDGVLRELMTLEVRNGDFLRASHQTTRNEWQRLSQALRNLQGLRRAYAGPSAHQWQSYS